MPYKAGKDVVVMNNKTSRQDKRIVLNPFYPFYCSAEELAARVYKNTSSLEEQESLDKLRKVIKEKAEILRLLTGKKVTQDGITSIKEV